MIEWYDIFIYLGLFVGLYFQVFLLYTFVEFLVDERRDRKKADARRTTTKLLSTSVIVPCYNEQDSVTKTIESLLGLEYPKHLLKIILVDDGSTDDTWQVIQQYKDHPQILLLQKENEGSKFAALNYGLEHANSEVIGCLDADSVVTPMALMEMMHVFAIPNTDVVTPGLLVKDSKNLLQKMQKVEFEMGLFFKEMFDKMNGLYIAPGPFSLFRSHVFEKIGNYKEAHHTEDCEMALRVQANHMRIRHAHKAIVYTMGVPKFKPLLKQRVRWVYGGMKNKLDYKFMMFNPKYGHLGMFVMPFSLVSLYITSVLLLAFIVNFGISVYRFVEHIININSFTWQGLVLDSSPYMWVNILMIAVIFGMIYFARYMTKQKIWSPDSLYGVFMLGIIAPIWIIKSVYNVARSKQSSWY